MGADPPPDDVAVARSPLLTVLEGGPAVGGPGHLEDARGPLYSLDAQATPETAGAQVCHEALDRNVEGATLRRCQGLQVPLEAGGRRPPGQAQSSSSEARNASSDSCTLNRPLAISAEASRSPVCQSGVQNQAWVASMTFLGRKRMPSAVDSTSK